MQKNRNLYEKIVTCFIPRNQGFLSGKERIVPPEIRLSVRETPIFLFGVIYLLGGEAF